MKIKRFLLDLQFFLVTSLFCNNPVIGYQKRTVPDPYWSFSNNFNTCLFDSWIADDVLRSQVACDSQQLCYGRYDGEKALFAVCYNTETLIPEYTGNIVESGGAKGEEGMITPPDLYDGGWKTDRGLVNAKIPVALDEDYEPYSQKGKFDNWDREKNQFLARGHLSPNGDFSKKNWENSFTYVTTNIAPQWQSFNMGNWVVVETAVQKYANQKGRTLYVFTGTGGRVRFNGKDIMLKNRVLTPKYFWKAVCDPKAKQSVIFVAENKPGEISTDRVAGCNGRPQTRKLGVVYCHSLQDAGLVPDYADFKLPPFTDEKCKPSVRGTFLDTFINGLK